MERTMTPLRQRMIEDLKLRNLSPHSQEAYVRAVAKVAQNFRKSPDGQTCVPTSFIWPSIASRHPLLIRSVALRNFSIESLGRN